MRRRYLILSAALVVMLSLTACSPKKPTPVAEPFVRNSTTQDPSKLTDFTSRELGFTLQYPAEWRAQKTSKSSVSFFYKGTGGEPAFQVSKIDEPVAQVFAKKMKLIGKSGNPSPDITLGDKPTKVLCFSSLEGSFCEYYVDMGKFTFVVEDYSKDQVYKSFKPTV